MVSADAMSTVAVTSIAVTVLATSLPTLPGRLASCKSSPHMRITQQTEKMSEALAMFLPIMILGTQKLLKMFLDTADLEHSTATFVIPVSPHLFLAS